MHSFSPSSKHLALAFGGTLALALTACGGGSSSDATAPPSPDTKVTLSGTVMIDQAIRNAGVCMDLNANGACDAGEPASARTGADGAYTLTYDSAQVSTAQAAAASLVAPMVPGTPSDAATTIDAAVPTEGNTARPYVLRQVPGKSGQINPLTTLVTAGMAAGMTEAAARSNTALQLAITESKIDGYQDEPASAGVAADTARTMAQVVAQALEDGATLVVGDQRASVDAASGDLASFTYADSTNYSYRTIDTVAKASGTLGTTSRDVRGGLTAGTPTPASTLYNQAYLTPTGWQRCNDSVDLQGTLGSPSRSTFCGALVQAGFTVREPIEAKGMAAVVTDLQADAATNTIYSNGTSTATLVGSLGTAVFPAGARLHTRYNLSVSHPVYINSISTDARPASESTLEKLIAARPAASVKLATGAGTLGLGLSSGPTRALRVAFTGTVNATSGTVQFYECDLDGTQTVLSNCSTTQTGTYAIETLHGTRVMRFAGHAPTTMNHTRGYAEVANAPTVTSSSSVYLVREGKADGSSSLTALRRLNAVAWAAMRSQLGL